MDQRRSGYLVWHVEWDRFLTLDEQQTTLLELKAGGSWQAGTLERPWVFQGYFNHFIFYFLHRAKNGFWCHHLYGRLTFCQIDHRGAGRMAPRTIGTLCVAP